MDITRLHKESDYQWRIEPTGEMRVPAILFGSEELIRGMDDKVYEQITNVATLPGIVEAAYAMPTGVMASRSVGSPPSIQLKVG